MKHFLTLILTAALFSTSAVAYDAYFHTAEMPNAVYYLPAPPDTLDASFAYDMSQYYWGKSVRDTERGAMAIADADCGTSHLCEIFSPYMAITISSEATPAIYKMLNNAVGTINKGVSNCKSYYKRVRPFQRFGDPVASGESLSQTSYPSGHTCRGWAMALLLVELDPTNQDAILQRGYEFGQSRVIVGAHWQSDVDAGRVVASACFARIHTDPTFMEDMAAAREEYIRLSGVEPAPAIGYGVGSWDDDDDE